MTVRSHYRKTQLSHNFKTAMLWETGVSMGKYNAGRDWEHLTAGHVLVYRPVKALLLTPIQQNIIKTGWNTIKISDSATLNTQNHVLRQMLTSMS